MTVYKLYGTAYGDNAASLDIQNEGSITAIQWAAQADIDADAEEFRAELSFASTSGFTANDTRASLSTIRMLGSLGAVGFVLPFVNLLVAPLDIQVQAGERLYMHITGTGSPAAQVTVYVFVDDGRGAAASRRRSQRQG